MTPARILSGKILSVLRNGQPLRRYKPATTAKTLCDVRPHIHATDYKKFLSIVRKYALKLDTMEIILLMSAIEERSPTMYTDLFAR
jgi:hypothetical protein